MLKKVFGFLKRHKIVSGLAVLVLLVGVFFAFKNLTASATQTSYILSAVEKGSVVVSVSGSGQVSASNQVDVSAKVSGDITSLSVAKGQEVKTGDVLAQIEAKDAISSIRNAQISLESAKLSMEKLTRGATESELESAELQLASAEKTLAQAQDDLTAAQAEANADLADAYADAKDTVQSIYDGMYDIMHRQLDGIYKYPASTAGSLNFRTSDSSAETDANNLRLKAMETLSKADDLLDNYPSDYDDVDAVLAELSSDLSSFRDFFDRLAVAVNAGISSSTVSASTLSGYKSSVSSLKNSANSSISSITSEQRTLANQKTTNKNNITSAENKVDDADTALIKAQNSLDDLKAGTDELELKSQQLQVRKAQIALVEAQEKLADYTIKASIDGIVAEMAVDKGDGVSANTTIATIITEQQIAEISLNEVDAAKVKIGQKATMIFDAIDDLTVAGQVVDIDAIGTVSQGVVSYTAKISLDANEDSIKPGMSVTASIITDSRQDILVVPNSAIKTSGDFSCVEVLDQESIAGDGSAVISDSLPSQVNVEIGLADDEYTEIISGLKEGDQVITKTVTTIASKSTSSQSNSLMQLLGGSRGSASTNTRSSGSASSGSTRSSSGSFSGGEMGGPPGM